MAEIAFCQACGAKHEVENDERCMCGGDLKPTSEMNWSEEASHRREWMAATSEGDA